MWASNILARLFWSRSLLTTRKWIKNEGKFLIYAVLLNPLSRNSRRKKMTKNPTDWQTVGTDRHTENTDTHRRTHRHTHLHTYTHTHIHTYTHTHIHTYIHTYTHTHMHTRTHAHTHTHTHTHTHSNTHFFWHRFWLRGVGGLSMIHKVCIINFVMEKKNHLSLLWRRKYPPPKKKPKHSLNETPKIS